MDRAHTDRFGSAILLTKYGREWAQNSWYSLLATAPYANTLRHRGYISYHTEGAIKHRKPKSLNWATNSDPRADLFELRVCSNEQEYRMFVIVPLQKDPNGHMQAYIYEPGGKLVPWDYYEQLGVTKTDRVDTVVQRYVGAIDRHMSTFTRKLQHDAFKTLTNGSNLIEYTFTRRITTDVLLSRRLERLLQTIYEQPVETHMLGVGIGPDQLYCRHVDEVARKLCDGIPEVFSVMYLEHILQKPITHENVRASRAYMNTSRADPHSKSHVMRTVLDWFIDRHSRLLSSTIPFEYIVPHEYERILSGHKYKLQRGPFTSIDIKRIYGLN